MSSFHYFLLCGSILLILISLTNAVPLDGDCTSNTECDVTGGTCRFGKCQCDTPWYTPCVTFGCIVKYEFAYEGQDCRDYVNCLENAECYNQTRCRCKTDYTAINGLCYKSLNTTCSVSTECWSNECSDGICKCPFGFVLRGDNNRCQRKLANIYSTWANANASNDFCYGLNSDGCRNSYAVCQNDSQHSEKFCQCPPSYTANYDRQECVAKVYTGSLSPANTPLPYEECGTCRDENALCLFVGNQTTCWCRSGFVNNNNKCDAKRPNMIFPNSIDITQHYYAFPNCSINGSNSTVIQEGGLCVCAPGFEFVEKNLPCRAIKPKRENDYLEYGVCTRINSAGRPLADYRFCPFPLSCQQRQDKFVCSCGFNQYLDERNNTCYLFLDKELLYLSSGSCPPYSDRDGTKCLCRSDGVYTVSTDQQRCELKLVDKQIESDCTTNRTNDVYCTSIHGTNTEFCSRGECRCISTRSYYENGTCVNLLNVDHGTNFFCPLNANKNSSNQCKCNPGYRTALSNRTCDRIIDRPFDSTNSPTQSSYTDVQKEDCKALFLHGPVHVYNSITCECDNGTYYNGSTCVYYLFQKPVDDDLGVGFCTEYYDSDNDTCICKPGYKHRSDYRTCEPLATTVYAYDDTTGLNTLGITIRGCTNLFGDAAIATKDDGYCTCRNTNIAFLNGNKCYLLVETNAISATPELCPFNSENNGITCRCRPGYQAIASKRGCERKNIYSPNIQAINPSNFTTACNRTYSDADCDALHGPGAVCLNNTCYCDRSQSFVNGDRCELFSKYVFRGLHERHLVTCNSQDDCGSDADRNGIECGYIESGDAYTVCKCKKDYFLNPLKSECVKNRCPVNCPVNEECQSYQCTCQSGFYRDSSGQCVKIETPLKLHDKCNTSFWNFVKSANEDLRCSSECQYAVCVLGYYDDGSRCVKNTFDDKCIHNTNQCTQISLNSVCSKLENKCACLPGYYRSQDGTICARAVNGNCSNQIDCGDFGQCLNGRCKCRPDRKEQQTTDSLGRDIVRCISGVDQIRCSLILLFFVLMTRAFFG